MSLNLLQVDFSEDGALSVEINEELAFLFENEQELINLIDDEALLKALQPIANEIVTRAKGIRHIELLEEENEINE